MTDGIDKNALQDAVLRTVIYSDLYNYPLTLDELRNDLLNVKIDLSEFESFMRNPNGLTGKVATKDRFVFLDGRSDLVKLRHDREEFTRKLIEKNLPSLKRIFNLPWVRTVALSGSSAFGNASEGDDIDLFVIVEPNRLWLVDLYNLFFVRILREKVLRKPRIICMNYLVDSVSMIVKKREFFTAHQLVHLKPLYDEGCWEYFIDANQWAWEFFPSSKPQSIGVTQRSPVKHITEIILNSLGAGIFNFLVYAIRGKRLSKMRDMGILNGEYNLRHLKANDSRSGLIASLKLKSSLERITSKSSLLDDVLNKEHVLKIERGIPDCIPDSYRESIDSFIEYLQSASLKKGTEFEPDELLNLPFGVKTNKSLWKIRAKNFRKTMSLVRSLDPESSGPILDLGAGNCWLSRHLLQGGYDTVSIDPMLDSQNGLVQGDIFEQNNNIRLNRVRGISQHMPFRDGSFKGIIASGSFHYTDDPAITLKEMARILDQDGWVIINDSPVFQSDESGEKMIDAKIDEFSNQSDYLSLKYKPTWYLNLPKFIRDAENLGFRVEIIKPRGLIHTIADRIRNRLLSKREWASFPIIILRKGHAQKSESKAGFIRTLRSLYFKQFVEPKLIPGREFVIDGIKLTVPPDVFHPLPYDSSRILLREIRKHHSQLLSKRVLDMGTGTGIHAIQCAKFDADVDSVDINQSAVECSKLNADRNEVLERINILQGDLFEPVQNEKYDLILFNPPYYEGDVIDPSDHAWKDKHGETLNRFIRELPYHLTRDGYALLIISDRMDLNTIEQKCSESRLRYETVRQKRVWDETYFIIRLMLEEPFEDQ